MLFKTITAFQDRVDYSKNEHGSWKAEFHGPVDVLVEGSTLEHCRRQAYDEFDAKLAAWVPDPTDTGRRRHRVVKEPRTLRGNKR